MSTATLDIAHELKVIRQDVEFIKKHMFDPDTIMTTEEEQRFRESLEELKRGETTPLSELKKELNL